MRKRTIAIPAALALGAVATASAMAGQHSPDQRGGDRYYTITVENLTKGQPFSPPFLAIHNPRASFWQVGAPASHATAAIAEDANNAPAIELAGKIAGVRHAFTGIATGATAPAPIGPGGMQTYTFMARGRYDRLSLLTMLVNSNDALTGLDAMDLPDHKGKSVMVYKRAYDGGSEVNDELAAHIPGPIGNSRFVRNPEGDVIRMHPGVTGVGDLDPAVHSLSGRVAKITITRTK